MWRKPLEQYQCRQEVTRGRLVTPGILSNEVRLAQGKKRKEHHAVFELSSRDEPNRMNLRKAGVYKASMERWERTCVLQQGCVARQTWESFTYWNRKLVEHLRPITQTLESLTSSRRGSRQPVSVQYFQHGAQSSSWWYTDVNAKTLRTFTPCEGIS